MTHHVQQDQGFPARPVDGAERKGDGAERKGSRWLGLTLVAAGVLVNSRSLGRLLAEDGRLDQAWSGPAILACQAVLLVGGLVLLLGAPRLSRAAVTCGLLVFGLLSVVGAFGNVRPLPEPTPKANQDPIWSSRYVRATVERVVRSADEACAWLIENDNPFFSPKMVEASQRELAAARAAGDPKTIVQTQCQLGDHLLRFGRGEEALAVLEEALGVLDEIPNSKKLEYTVRRQLGLTWLRLGETSHCIAMHNPASCLFPIQKEGVWANPEAAEKSVEYFEWCMRQDPEDYATRWLLNVAHMAKGTYPAGLAPELLIECDSTRDLIDVPRFTDVATKLEVDNFDLAGGAVMDDFDGDGLLDVMTSTQDPCGQLHYFHNEGGGPFTDWTERSGLKGEHGGLNLFQVDYDDDGRLDLFAPRGAWLVEYGLIQKSLYHQEPDGTFRDLAVQAGMASVAYPCQAAGWDDYDLDGDLDVFVAGEQNPCELYRNNGDMTFTDVAAEAGVTNDSWYAKGVAWGDYDDDGDSDLYVSNLGQAERLFQNHGNGTFTDVAPELGVTAVDKDGRSLTFTTWFFDYDNDGRLDIYVSGFGASMDDVVRDYLGIPTGGERLNLFRNTGKAFENVAPALGLADVRLPMGANYGDVDNDGWLDIYLGTGKPQFDMLFPNLLYKNVEGKQFVDATKPAGLGHLQKGHGVAFGDLDNDGDQDILAEMGGLYPDDEFVTSLFENPGSGNRWLTVELRGTETNHFGVGCRVQVDVRRPDGSRRSVHLLGGSGGSFGASSLQQEFGLADAVAIEQLIVYWPVSRQRQVITGVPLDNFIRVTEGQDGFELLERKRFAL